MRRIFSNISRGLSYTILLSRVSDMLSGAQGAALQGVHDPTHLCHTPLQAPAPGRLNVPRFTVWMYQDKCLHVLCLCKYDMEVRMVTEISKCICSANGISIAWNGPYIPKPRRFVDCGLPITCIHYALSHVLLMPWEPRLMKRRRRWQHSLAGTE